MILKTVVPKEGDTMPYMGKPVYDNNGNRVGFITDVLDSDGHFDLIMDVPGVISLPDLKVGSWDEARVGGDVTIMEFNDIDTRTMGITMEEACDNINNLKKLNERRDDLSGYIYALSLLGVPEELIKSTENPVYQQVCQELEIYKNKFKEEKENE